MLTNSPTKRSKLNCQSDLQTSRSPFFSWCVRSYMLIYIYFLFDKWGNVSFKSVFKSLNPTTINAFTETQKFIGTSKAFSCRLEKNFPAIILLFPLSRIWNISQNTDELSYNIRYLSARWQRRTLSAKCISSLDNSLGRNRECSSEIAQNRADWKVHFQPLLNTQGSSESGA